MSLLDEGEAKTRRAMEAIEAYLARHPLAADTEQGIAQWWLPDQGVTVPIVCLRVALDALVQQGRLCAVPLPDGRVLYRSAVSNPP